MHRHDHQLRILWATTLSSDHGLRNGGTLRFASLSRELAGFGHRVRAARLCAVGSGGSGQDALEAELIRDFGIEEIVRVDPPMIPASALRRSRIGISPLLRYRLLDRFLRPLAASLNDLIRRFDPDVMVIGSRQFLPIVPHLSRLRPLFIDWCDSEVLARFREARSAIEAGRHRVALRQLHAMAQACLEERAYGRLATMNLVASPVDQRWLDRAIGGRPRSHIIGNGVALGAAPALPKAPSRLIFSGNMDFPPNYKAALWFIDNVLPLITAARPDVELIVAGQYPNPSLLDRSHGRVRVVGYVEDLRELIAGSALYVAPMISGSGFKNKVVEALEAGTLVAATPMGVEFLPAEVRNQLIVGHTPEALARGILDFLAAPGSYAGRLGRVVATVRANYSWSGQALLLEHLMLACVGDARPDATGAQ